MPKGLGGGGEGRAVTRKFEFLLIFPEKDSHGIVVEPLAFSNKQSPCRGEKIAAKVRFIHKEHLSLKLVSAIFLKLFIHLV